MPELQGRLPIRVHLNPLSRSDMKAILVTPKYNIVRQTTELLKSEGVELDFTDGALDVIADAACAANSGSDDIGARRLRTILSRVVEEISFDAHSKVGERIAVDEVYAKSRLRDVMDVQDFKKFIL